MKQGPNMPSLPYLAIFHLSKWSQILDLSTRCAFWLKNSHFWQKCPSSKQKMGLWMSKSKFQDLLQFKHSPNMGYMAFSSSLYHFWALFQPKFNVGDFRAYLGHFYLVKEGGGAVLEIGFGPTSYRRFWVHLVLPKNA